MHFNYYKYVYTLNVLEHILAYKFPIFLCVINALLSDYNNLSIP